MTTRKRTTRTPATKPTVEAVTEVAEITEKVTVETPAVEEKTILLTLLSFRAWINCKEPKKLFSKYLYGLA